MSRKNFLYNAWRADDEEEVPEERPKSDLMIFSKKAGEDYFLTIEVYNSGEW